MNKVKQINVVKTYSRTIEMEKIENTPYSYYVDTKIETVTDKTAGTEKTYNHVIHGAALDEEILKAKGLISINDIVPASKIYEGKAKIKVITKSDLEKVQHGEVHITDIIYSRNYEVKPIKDDEMLVLWNSGDEKIAYLSGDYIPIPIRIGYMEGNLDNGAYDLDKVLELLKNDKHVLNRENLEITHIPYYNCFGEQNKSIECKYLPDHDDYQTVMALKNCLNRPYYVLNELIGAKAFKIERSDY